MAEQGVDVRTCKHCGNLIEFAHLGSITGYRWTLLERRLAPTICQADSSPVIIHPGDKGTDWRPLRGHQPSYSTPPALDPEAVRAWLAEV